MKKKRFCIVGASGRGYRMYAQSLLSEQFRDLAEVCGIYDINIGRSRYVSDNLPEAKIKVYEDYDEMLRTEKPDAVIVTTVDVYHAPYAIKALEFGCDAIIEKPMAIDAEQVYGLLEAEKRTGKKITVTHNMRYMPYKLKIKELLAEGAIGDIYNVNFEWNLIYRGHGTSYYRRWNGYMEKSGGLLLTKSSHHFDIANWYINSYPSKVSAFGALKRYGKNNPFRGKSCRECEHTAKCEFYKDMTGSQYTKEFYFDNEKYDGYIYDGCVFNEKLDAYDTVNLSALYENGVTMSYTLNANVPFEGWSIVFNGSRGRLEAGEISAGPGSTDSKNLIKIMDMDQNTTEINISKVGGSHGGGDIRLLEDIFIGRDSEDKYSQRATVLDGAASVLLGAAGNESIKLGKTIDINELLGAKLEDYR